MYEKKQLVLYSKFVTFAVNGSMRIYVIMYPVSELKIIGNLTIVFSNMNTDVLTKSDYFISIHMHDVNIGSVIIKMNYFLIGCIYCFTAHVIAVFFSDQ